MSVQLAIQLLSMTIGQQVQTVKPIFVQRNLIFPKRQIFVLLSTQFSYGEEAGFSCGQGFLLSSRFSHLRQTAIFQLETVRQAFCQFSIFFIVINFNVMKHIFFTSRTFSCKVDFPDSGILNKLADSLPIRCPLCTIRVNVERI